MIELTPRKASAFVLLAGALLAIALPGGATAGPKSPFKPGLYVGKTSQGEPVKLLLTVGGPECEGKACLFPPIDEDEINVNLSCNIEGDSTNAYLAGFAETIPKSGVIHTHEKAFSTIVTTIKVGHGGSLSGTTRATGKLEDGAKCDSGNVTFKAKIGGSTK
jgi:hypothetical protein